jgi:hypothetical protein
MVAKNLIYEVNETDLLDDEPRPTDLRPDIANHHPTT